MKLMLPEQMREIDKAAINEYDIPGILLMEHAAYQVFSHIKACGKDGQVTIVCGPGNNGGDGFAIARQLLNWSKMKVYIVMATPYEQLSQEGKIYHDIDQKQGLDIIQYTVTNKTEIENLLNQSEVIVDALLGTGLTRNITGAYAELIGLINGSRAYKVCVDIPSGIDGTTGEIKGCCVKGDVTITFVLPKLGLYLYPAIDYTGEVKVVDIGIPKQIIDQKETTYFSIESTEMKDILPLRPTRSNKGSFGKVIVIGGSKGLSGAAVMTSLSALKVGAGLVTAAVPDCIHDIMEQKLTEVMTIPLSSEEGHFSMRAIEEIERIADTYDLITIGPGLGRSAEAKELVKTVLQISKPIVVDADGLYFINEYKNILRERKEPTILTPHPGEMGRLIGLSSEEVLHNPVAVAKEFAIQNKVILVLKLEKTVIADTSGNIYINRGGNTGMAKGGSGDVLTGIITGLWAQHIAPISAATLGVYVHSRSADIMLENSSPYTLMPTEITQGIDLVFKELIRNGE